MATAKSTKARSVKKTTTTAKKDTKRKPRLEKSSSNQMHIFAGFLLGLCVGMLFFGAYLVTFYIVS